MSDQLVGISIQDTYDFKSWRLAYKNQHDLLKAIIFDWRASSAQVPGKPGKWAAYPIDVWAKRSSLSRDQTKRALKALVENGLIDRERHRYGGITVCPFIRPTALALKHMGRPQDIVRLGPSAPIAAPILAPIGAPIDAPIAAPTDYTSLPSISNKIKPAIVSKQISSDISEGKGKAGGDETGGKKKPILLLLKKPVAVSPEPIPEPVNDNGMDEIELMAAKVLAKKAAKAGKDFPILKGAHEGKVKHPSTWPEWPSYSDEAKANVYKKYEGYVANFYKGKAGKPYIENEISDEEWEKTVASFASDPDEWDHVYAAQMSAGKS
jgi:hypothetical protein